MFNYQNIMTAVAQQAPRNKYFHQKYDTDNLSTTLQVLNYWL